MDQNTQLNMFNSLRHISERFPNMHGNELQHRVFRDYVISQQDVTLRLIDEQGEETLTRHRVNKRDHQAVREQYVQNVLTQGVVVGVRGQPWAVPNDRVSPGGVQHHGLISCATLTESLYEARRRDPGNRFVVQTIRDGLPNAKIFHPRTPDDVLYYLRSLHNQFHRGAGTSHLELHEKVPAIEAGRSEHTRKNHLTSRGCAAIGKSWDKCYEEFLNENFTGLFKKYNHFKCAKIFLHGMEKLSIMQAYIQDCNAKVNFANPKFSVEGALVINRDVYVTIYEGFVDTVPADHLKVMLLEALKFVVPIADAGDSVDEDTRWVFEGGAKPDALKALKCPMGGSVVFKSGQKSHQKEMRKKEEKGSKGQGKGKGKKGKKNKDDGKTVKRSSPVKPGAAKGLKKSIAKMLSSPKSPSKKNKKAEAPEAQGSAQGSSSADAPPPQPDVGKGRGRGRGRGNSGKGEAPPAEAVDMTESWETTAAIIPRTPPARPDPTASDDDVAGDAIIAPVPTPDVTSREKLFLDDLYSAISSVVRKVPDDKVKFDSIKWAYSQGIFFGLSKKVMDGAVAACPQLYGATLWSHVRAALRSKVAADHAGIPGVDAVAASNIATSINCTLQRVVDEKSEMIKIKMAALDRLWDDAQMVADLSMFLLKNDVAMPVTMQPAFQEINTAIFTSIRKESPKEGLDIDAVVKSMQKYMKNHAIFNRRDLIVPVLHDLFENWSLSVPQRLQPIFPDAVTIKSFCRRSSALHCDLISATLLSNGVPARFRVEYVMGILNTLCTGSTKVVKHPFLTQLAMISDIVEVVSHVDVHLLHDTDNAVLDWERFWAELLATASQEASTPSTLSAFVQSRLDSILDHNKKQNSTKLGEQQVVNQPGSQKDDQPTETTQETKEAKLKEAILATRQPMEAVMTDIVNMWGGLATDHEEEEKKPLVEDHHRMRFLEVCLEAISRDIHKAALDLYTNTADNGLDGVYVDPICCGSGAWCVQASRSVRMNFIGPLSLIPSVGSIKIAEVDGMGVYVRCKINISPNKGGAYINEYVAPAWLVRPVKATCDGEPVEVPTMSIAHKTIQVDVKYSKAMLSPPLSVKIPVKLFYMTVLPGFYDKCVELTRPWIDEEVRETTANMKTFKASDLSRKALLLKARAAEAAANGAEDEANNA
ncbi:unnamed protein product, partial [Prorocentrum cordatum]